jgi:prolyl oligopeptidase
MKKLIILLLWLSPFLLNAQLKYPVTEKKPVVDDYSGVKVEDPYRWMEDDNSEAVKQWVEQENAVTTGYLSKIPYRRQWLSRLQEVTNYPRYTTPFRVKEYFYFSKNDGLQNQSLLYRQKGLSSEPELVLDPNKFSSDGTTSLATFSVSKDGHWAVVGKSTGGSDWRTFFVMDLTSLKYLPDSLAWIKVSGASWQEDGFYYSRYPSTEKGKELSTKK